jgi:lysozyme family protein
MKLNNPPSANKQSPTNTNIPPVALRAILAVLAQEGGYVNNPNDNGGETNFGISKRWFPDVDIKNLTREKAANIYYWEYWFKNKCHLMPPAVASMVFDTAVNQGGSFARKTLQMLVGVNQDGIIGSQTIAAIELTNNYLLLNDYAKARCQRYANLVKKDTSQIIFLEGWLNRAFNVLTESLIMLLELAND